MKTILLRKILGGFSFASALFMFQACYGTPQDVNTEVFVEGRVTSAKTGDPVKGIKISNNEGIVYQYSDPDGKFSFYTSPFENKKFHFDDIDSTENGTFLSKDTIPEIINDYVYLDIKLQEQ